MLMPRASGILLHPTSLPSRGGIGDLGPAAYDFINFLSEAKQSLWQVLPLGPVGYGNSPYSSTSAFAGNPLMISLERLAQYGWIDRGRFEHLLPPAGNVEFEKVWQTKYPLIEEAARGFLASAAPQHRGRFEAFCQENAWWLEDYALYEVLRREYGGKSWTEWPRELATRNNDAQYFARERHATDIEIVRAIQFAFFEQWNALHYECRRRGIQIMGDVAIFVSFDSADVWTHPDIFRLDQNLNPEVVAGVPPDAFSSTGQRWGNPLYRWDALKSRGYEWWVQRMSWTLKTCDLVRIDHFRGFEAYWEIPASEPTAVNGHWVKGPADDLFNVLRERLGGLPLIAEDLGVITPEVNALRERLQIPSMKVLQFGFGDPGAHIYLPHRYERDTVVYTGTHDNDTTPGWWNTVRDHERRAANAYFGSSHEGIEWAMIRAAETSVSQLCVIPLQDVLGLGSEARMNVPSRPDGNWAWRYAPGSLKPELARKLGEITEVADRVSATGENGDREAGKDFAA
ncbi:MAG TPA: 4-alpha-glucanotransferase [Terriglobales bacterium]|nr:4-alpha-glucanotransferase [Terriglobales bacterium]